MRANASEPHLEPLEGSGQGLQEKLSLKSRIWSTPSGPFVRKIPYMAVRYLYLRTSIALEHATDVLRGLAEMKGYNLELLRVSGDKPSFVDGFVTRFYSRQKPKELRSWLQSVLSRFEHWVCHDGFDQCVEEPSGGPASTFFENLGAKSLTQVVVRLANERSERAVEMFRASVEGKGYCRPVMRFRNGVVLLVASNAPPHITPNRCQTTLKRTAPYTAIASDEACFTADGLVPERMVWTSLGPSLASFGT